MNGIKIMVDTFEGRIWSSEISTGNRQSFVLLYACSELLNFVGESNCGSSSIVSRRRFP